MGLCIEARSAFGKWVYSTWNLEASGVLLSIDPCATSTCNHVCWPIGQCAVSIIRTWKYGPESGRKWPKTHTCVSTCTFLYGNTTSKDATMLLSSYTIPASAIQVAEYATKTVLGFPVVFWRSVEVTWKVTNVRAHDCNLFDITCPCSFKRVFV